MKPYRYHPAADQEFEEAIDHDEAELPGRGERLEHEVGRVVFRVRRFPLSAPVWPGLDSIYEVRRAKVRRHPFLVVYMVHPDHLIILAVAHTRKEPGYWRGRIGDAAPATPRRTKRKPARSKSRENERGEQISSPGSAQGFLPIFSPDPFLLDKDVLSPSLTASDARGRVDRSAQRCAE